MKRDALDAVFSDLVRERAAWTCEKCGRYAPEGMRQGMHCSHNYGRRLRSVRWWPLNGTCLCYPCHTWYESYPPDSQDWLRHKLGDLYDILRERANTPRKYTAAERRDMLKHYRAEWKRLQEARRSGKTGRLEFKGYD